MALIPLSEYARKHRRSEVTLRQLAARGNLPTAQKIGSQWVVDANAPYPDYRHSSDRASNVLTLVAPENVSSVFSRITESAPKYGVFLDVFDIRQNPHLKNPNDPYSIDNTRYFTLIWRPRSDQAIWDCFKAAPSEWEGSGIIDFPDIAPFKSAQKAKLNHMLTELFS